MNVLFKEQVIEHEMEEEACLTQVLPAPQDLIFAWWSVLCVFCTEHFVACFPTPSRSHYTVWTKPFQGKTKPRVINTVLKINPHLKLQEKSSLQVKINNNIIISEFFSEWSLQLYYSSTT